MITFRHIEPHYLLRDYIDKMWLFESNGKMAEADVKLIVPNGNLKLTVSYKNAISAVMNGRTFYSREHDITLTGMVDVPVILDVAEDVPAETIGIEFNPRGAYRFFHFSLSEIQNQIWSLGELPGKAGAMLTAQINLAETTTQKIALLQQFLIRQLSLQDADPVFDYCIERILASKGRIRVGELERKTGYSSRWLNRKFGEKLGVSPKNLSSVIRFRECYQTFLRTDKKGFFRNDFSDWYYDHSHFIRDFRRFTGFPPGKFEKQINELGTIYYG